MSDSRKGAELWCPGTESNCRHGDFQFSRPAPEKAQNSNVSAVLRRGNHGKYENETRIVLAQESAQPDRCCRNCEYWDAGGERLRHTARIGDCHNPYSDRFTPPPDHVCPQFFPNTEDADD